MIIYACKYCKRCGVVLWCRPVVMPSFDEAGQAAGLTDFNDLHQHAEIEAIGRQINHAMAQVIPDFYSQTASTRKEVVRVFQSDDVM